MRERDCVFSSIGHRTSNHGTWNRLLSDDDLAFICRCMFIEITLLFRELDLDVIACVSPFLYSTSMSNVSKMKSEEPVRSSLNYIE